MNISAGRPYRMTRRAAAAEATGERILDAAAEVFMEDFELPLRAVAERAGVSEQTVIRRFGGKSGLFQAASRREFERIAAQRDQAPSDDLGTAIAVLVEHYEENGRGVLRMLADEDRHPELREVTGRGRELHEAWCRRVFGGVLETLGGAERKRRLAQLIAITDVYAWRLLRIDRGLSRPQTELAMRELAESLTGGSR